MLDGADRHSANDRVVPDDITLAPSPSCARELESFENDWQSIRNNGLGGRIFASCDGAVERCCDAWICLVAQPLKIISLGPRHWAHRS